jgi:oligoendopeptidase F
MSSSQKKNLTGAENIHWDLTDLYPSADADSLEMDKKRVVEFARGFSEKYRGRIAELTSEEFAVAMERYEDIYRIVGKIGSFAYLSWSVNTEDAALGKHLQQANELGSEVSQLLVFFNVEWLEMDEERAAELTGSEDLKKWKHYLRVSRQYKDHTLGEEAEQVMSAKSVTGRTAWTRFFDETLGAARFYLDGEKLTEQEVLSKLHNTDRNLRKQAHESLTNGFREHSRTLTFIFNTILADKYTNDKLRNYKSWISSRNLSNQIDDATVNALITAVTGRYELVQRYYHLKKKLLNVEEMFDYDRYAPVAQTTKTVHWNEARELVLEAYGEFHPEMRAITARFFDKNWIDAAIKPGKRGGAYSASTVTSVHPYIFMNYDGQLRDVQTLAHELGHGVHQYMSRKQGEFQSSTPLTTAETASVFGEMLVFNKLMAAIDEPAEKLSLLISKIDDTIATVFRQVSMNRFENAIHTARRETGELTTEHFSDKWHEVQKDLYGDSITITDEYRLWWCYIPHFLHTPGYVYAYAFGELLVLALYDVYQRSDKKEFSEKYMRLLEAGGSDWPHKLVQKLDLDITQPGFWNNGLKLFENMVEEAEKLAASI